jgi:dTDP-4-dehydrorhamnose 3,5-epimerase
MSGRFEIVEESLGGLCVLRKRVLSDERGYLTRMFDAGDLAESGCWPWPVAQVNETGTARRGTLRGLHFQFPPFAEAKLVACTRGAILDVALDLRRGSPTFLAHVAVELSAGNGLSLLIPPGFAHGYQSLCDDVTMLYIHSQPYRAEAEGGIDARDAALAIDWPLPVSVISERDRSHRAISADFEGLS